VGAPIGGLGKYSAVDIQKIVDRSDHVNDLDIAVYDDAMSADANTCLNHMHQ
jgi:hypothetical protein